MAGSRRSGGGATLLICPSIVSALQAMEARVKRLRESRARAGETVKRRQLAARDSSAADAAPPGRDSQSRMRRSERDSRRRCVCIPSRHCRSSSVNIYSCSPVLGGQLASLARRALLASLSLCLPLTALGKYWNVVVRIAFFLRRPALGKLWYLIVRIDALCLRRPALGK